ncbi:MAG TPA: signal peptidase I [Candidatus Saccharimonadales bacterium]|nr:signal peptidase I [Candidatus Saccharimonadales bacterium]
MPAHNESSQVTSSALLPGWVRIVLIGRDWRLTLARLAVLVAACFVFFRFVLLPVRVEGISMLPTYRNGSVNFVNRLAYLWHGPRRGDVVGIRLSDPGVMPPSVMYLKRIIGLPGETVSFFHGRVLIDNHALDEPYEKYECDWNLPPVKLGPDQYFVVGDNRSMPSQFHVFGKVELNHIVGKAIL